jgi:Uma2 family endonuclease
MGGVEMSSLAVQPRYTPQEYLALERAATEKSEYVNGEIYAMAGTSKRHNRITVNLLRKLSTQLDGRPCEAYIIDIRVKVSETGMYTYPDLTVICGDVQVEDDHEDILLNPTLIVEVLSPSTEAYDRGEKFAHYRKIPSLTDYLLVAQDRIHVEHFVRQGNQWLLSEYDDLEAAFDLTAIGCRLTLRDIYDKITWPIEKGADA